MVRNRTMSKIKRELNNLCLKTTKNIKCYSIMSIKYNIIRRTYQVNKM